MLSELCAELRNYFLRDYANPEQYIHTGVYAIRDGAIQDLHFLKAGQYFRIVGSALNDGVYRYGDENGLTDEEFEGAIWEMFVPPDFLKLSEEIEEWNSKYSEFINSPYQSESFGGYSYTKALARNGTGSIDWQTNFDSRLKKWRRINVL